MRISVMFVVLLTLSHGLIRQLDPWIESLYSRGPLLGEGTFGRVYNATNISSGEVVAAKIHCDDDIRDKSINEVKLLDQISRKPIPNVVEFKEAFSYTKNHEPCWTMMTEILQSSDLQKYWRSSPRATSEQLAAYALRPVLEALRDLHGRRIAHLDVKPGNFVFRTSRGLHDPNNLVLVDFGGAQVLPGDVKRVRAKQWTKIYLPMLDRTSPDRYMSAEELMSRDVFAMGVCFFILTVDSYPQFDPETGFLANSTNEGLSKKGKLGVEAFEKLNFEMRYLVMSMTHPDYLKRPGFDKILTMPMFDASRDILIDHYEISRWQNEATARVEPSEHIAIRPAAINLALDPLDKRNPNPSTKRASEERKTGPRSRSLSRSWVASVFLLVMCAIAAFVIIRCFSKRHNIAAHRAASNIENV